MSLDEIRKEIKRVLNAGATSYDGDGWYWNGEAEEWPDVDEIFGPAALDVEKLLRCAEALGALYTVARFTDADQPKPWGDAMEAARVALEALR